MKLTTVCFTIYLINLDYMWWLWQNSGCRQYEVPDDRALVGFAQLSLLDPSDPEAQLDQLDQH